MSVVEISRFQGQHAHMTDLTFVGAVVGGLLALTGTTYLAFSANKRESIAAIERQLEAWHIVAQGEATRGGWPDIMKFVSQGPFVWSHHEAWEIHNTASRNLMGEATIGGSQELQDKFIRLRKIATNRIVGLSRILEDMKRRSAWGFFRVEYVQNIDDYRFRVIKETWPEASP